MSEQQNLTARQIFDEITTGKIIRVCLSEEEFRKLKISLNVFKTRNKKLYESLGLDYERMIIRWSKIITNNDYIIQTYSIWLEQPKENPRYPCFVITPQTEDQETLNNHGNSTNTNN